MNGNRWVGPGHNTVFQDFDGQWWTIYHAVDVQEPYFEGAAGFTKRPPLMDQLDWVDGWPIVRGGRFASDTAQPAPAAQPGTNTNARLRLAPTDVPGTRIASASDEFSGTSLSSGWSWVREPSSGYSVSGGAFHMDTQAADLFVDSNNASVLTRDAPDGDYIVQAKVRLSLPAEGCCFNYVQAGLVMYGSDDAFIKLATVSIWETRQTEFAKEVPPPVPSGYPRYGNSVVGPPGEWTWLRLVVRTEDVPDDSVSGPYGGTERYTAYTSHDGVTWTRGGTWAHQLGDGARIGLVAMGGSGFTADFDYVRVFRTHR
jgi:arabinan endo-1,5-alpha-L-arabinosidase